MGHERAQAELAEAGAGTDLWEQQKLALERALVRMQAMARAGGAGGGHS